MFTPRWRYDLIPEMNDYRPSLTRDSTYKTGDTTWDYDKSLLLPRIFLGVGEGGGRGGGGEGVM